MDCSHYWYYMKILDDTLKELILYSVREVGLTLYVKILFDTSNFFSERECVCITCCYTQCVCQIVRTKKPVTVGLCLRIKVLTVIQV